MPNEVLKNLKNHVDDDPSKITVADLERAVEAGDFDDPEELYAIGQSLANLAAEFGQAKQSEESELLQSFFDTFADFKSKNVDAQLAYAQAVRMGKDPEIAMLENEKRMAFIEAIDAAINPESDIAALDQYQQDIYYAYQRLDQQSSYIIDKRIDFLNQIKQINNDNPDLIDQIFADARVSLQNHQAFIEALRTQSSVRRIMSINEHANREHIYETVEKLTNTQSVFILLYLKYIGLFEGNIGDHSEGSVNDKTGLMTQVEFYQDFLAHRRKRSGRLLGPDVSMKVDAMKKYQNGEFSHIEGHAFLTAVGSLPIIKKLHELHTKQDIEDFINRYSLHSHEIVVLQFYLAERAQTIGLYNGINDNLTGHVNDKDLLTAVLEVYVDEFNNATNIEYIEEAERFVAFQNKKRVVEWTARIYESMLSNTKFTAAFFRSTDDKYETHANHIKDYLRILPDIQNQEQLDMIIERIFVPLEMFELQAGISNAVEQGAIQMGISVSPFDTDGRRAKVSNLFSGLRNGLSSDLSFSTQEDMHSFIMGFVQGLREIDENNELGFRSYETTSGMSDYLDSYLYQASFDKSGLESREIYQAEQLENRLTNIEKVMDDPDKIEEIISIVNPQEQERTRMTSEKERITETMLVYNYGAIGAKLVERGICGSEDSRAYASRLISGVKKLYSRKQQRISQIKNELFQQHLKMHRGDPNFPQQQSDMTQEQKNNLTTFADMMFQQEKTQFMHGAFQKAMTFETLKTYQPVISTLQKSDTPWNQMLGLKMDIEGVGFGDWSDETWNTLAVGSAMFVQELITFIPSLMLTGGIATVIGKAMQNAVRVAGTAIKIKRIQTLTKIIAKNPLVTTIFESIAQGTMLMPIKALTRSLLSSSVNGWDELMTSITANLTAEEYLSTIVQIGFLRHVKYMMESGKMLSVQSQFTSQHKFLFAKYFAENGLQNIADYVFDITIGNSDYSWKDFIINMSLGLAFEAGTFFKQAKHNPIIGLRQRMGLDFEVARDMGHEYSHRSQNYTDQKFRVIAEGMDSNQKAHAEAVHNALAENTSFLGPHTGLSTSVTGSGSLFMNTPYRGGDIVLPKDIDYQNRSHEFLDVVTNMRQALLDGNLSFTEFRVTTVPPNGVLLTITADTPISILQQLAKQADQGEVLRVEWDNKGMPEPSETFFNPEGNGVNQETTGLQTQIIMVDNMPVRIQTPEYQVQPYILNLLKEWGIDGEKTKDRILRISKLMPDMNSSELIDTIYETVENYRKLAEKNGVAMDPYVESAIRRLDDVLQSTNGKTGLIQLIDDFRSGIHSNGGFVHLNPEYYNTIRNLSVDQVSSSQISALKQLADLQSRMRQLDGELRGLGDSPDPATLKRLAAEYEDIANALINHRNAAMIEMHHASNNASVQRARTDNNNTGSGDLGYFSMYFNARTALNQYIAPYYSSLPNRGRTLESHGVTLPNTIGIESSRAIDIQGGGVGATGS